MFEKKNGFHGGVNTAVVILLIFKNSRSFRVLEFFLVVAKLAGVTAKNRVKYK